MKQEFLAVADDILQIKENCAEEISFFGEQFRIMYKLYNILGLYYPEECNTNYRDSWFHFRKLYKKKDMISVLNEKYGLEEHLLRAAKDAQICLLQQLGSWLEVWYDHEARMAYDKSREKEYEQLLCVPERNWVSGVERKAQDDVALFANTCLYFYTNSIDSESVRKKLQVLIHSIKNLILDLRLGGVDISRPSDNVHYLRQCVSVYNDMCIALQETGILYLISSTEVILSVCGRE